MKFLFLFIFFIFSLAHAQDSRWIDLEWEAVQGARDYEIELFQNEDGKSLPRGKYKVESPAWSHAVPPGKYSLRLRSIDSRGVPGEWSDYIPLKVRMQNPLLLRPVPDGRLSDEAVEFEWGPVKGADKYQLVVKDKDNHLLHSSVTEDLRLTVYLDKLGDVFWTSLALENDEDKKELEDISPGSFQHFVRVGGELEAPEVSLKVNEKVIFKWNLVRNAKIYEVDYLPPPESKDKNRRFKLRKGPLAFPTSRLKEGVTTLSIKALSPGYKDSKKSFVKISRNGNKAEVEDIIQGREQTALKSVPTKTFFRDELFLGVTLAQFSYESENFKTDTRLNQKSLTGLGFNGEWIRRPSFNSLGRKLEVSILHLSSGIDSGFANRLAYTLHKYKKSSQRTYTYGGGLSVLSLPAFMGNRFDNKILVESSTSVGPEFQVGLINPLSDIWELQANLALAYHPLFISSRGDGGEAFPFIKALVRFQRYYTEKQAFYGQLDYQSWNQNWGKDSSALSGISLSFGVKTGF